MELLSHVIGTGGLLVFMLLITASFSSLEKMTTFDLIRIQLKEITDRESSQLFSLIVMANSSDAKSLFFYQSVDVPQSVGTYGYSLSLEKVGGLYYVKAKLDRYSGINALSSLPLNSTSMAIIFDTSDVGSAGPNVLKASHLYSGTTNGVMWCKKQDGTIYLGFGRSQS